MQIADADISVGAMFKVDFMYAPYQLIRIISDHVTLKTGSVAAENSFKV